MCWAEFNSWKKIRLVGWTHICQEPKPVQDPSAQCGWTQFKHVLRSFILCRILNPLSDRRKWTTMTWSSFRSEHEWQRVWPQVTSLKETLIWSVNSSLVHSESQLKASLRFPPEHLPEDERRDKNVNLIKEKNQPSVLLKDVYPSQNAPWLRTQALSVSAFPPSGITWWMTVWELRAADTQTHKQPERTTDRPSASRPLIFTF